MRNYNPNPNYCPNLNGLSITSVSQFPILLGAAVQLPGLTAQIDAGISKRSQMPCLPRLLVDFPGKWGGKSWFCNSNVEGVWVLFDRNLSTNRANRDVCGFVAFENTLYCSLRTSCSSSPLTRAMKQNRSRRPTRNTKKLLKSLKINYFTNRGMRELACGCWYVYECICIYVCVYVYVFMCIYLYRCYML